MGHGFLRSQAFREGRVPQWLINSSNSVLFSSDYCQYYITLYSFIVKTT